MSDMGKRLSFLAPKPVYDSIQNASVNFDFGNLYPIVPALLRSPAKREML
jgi:hypothetical protein